MPVLKSTDCTPHHMHGSQFSSYVAPSLGSSQLCAWRVEVAPSTTGAAHTVSHEEVFLALTGSPIITLDGHPQPLSPGDVVFIPAGTTLRLDNPSDQAATLWVTTPVGLTARTPEGQTITPPWTQ